MMNQYDLEYRYLCQNTRYKMYTCNFLGPWDLGRFTRQNGLNFGVVLQNLRDFPLFFRQPFSLCVPEVMVRELFQNFCPWHHGFTARHRRFTARLSRFTARHHRFTALSFRFQSLYICWSVIQRLGFLFESAKNTFKSKAFYFIHLF